MTYHRATDPVITPDGPAIYWQTWPDEDMGKVQLAKGSRWPGRFRSYRLDDIQPMACAIVDAVKAAGFESVVRSHHERL